MPMLRIRKGDEVKVIAGKDRGKTGVVQEVHPQARRITVAGVNIVKRHTKPNPQRNVRGGIIDEPSPLDVAKVMLLCPHCHEAARVGHRFSDEGEKERYCKNCGEEISVVKES